jgi:hypothetical protein
MDEKNFLMLTALIGILLSTFGNVNFFNVNIRNILAIYLVLSFAYVKNIKYAVLSGLIIGTICEIVNADMGTFLIGYNKFTNNWGNVSSIVLNNGFLDFGYNQIYNSFSKYSGIFYFDSGLASVYGNDMINITFSKSGILYNINSNVSFINNYIEQNNFSAVETNDTNNYVGAFCNFGNLILLNNTIKKITGNYFGIILNNNLTILNNNLITNNNATFGGVIYNNASLYLKTSSL